MRRLFVNFVSFSFFLMVAHVAQAGHLFTQASSNTPTWIQQGKGIAITQYGDEGGAGSGNYSINFEQPTGGMPAEATQGDPGWWQWSSGDVMRITIPLADATYTRTIAYDADPACAYDECGATGSSSLSGSWTDLGGVGVTLPAHTGQQTSYTDSDVGFSWTIESLAGEFALGGYRFYTSGGTLDGTGAGPLDQSSVVDSNDLPGSGGPRDITNSDDTQGGLGSSTTYAFDGGTLTVTGDESADFIIKDGGGAIAVGSGETHELSGNLSDDTGASGTFAKTGDGTLVLSGTNTHTGGTVISGGQLRVTSDTALGGAGSGIALDGGTLGISGDIATTRSFSIGAGNGGIDVAGGNTLDASGTIAGAGDLSKSGDGRFRVSGTSTLGGTVNVQGGELSVEGSMSAAAMNIFGGARLSGSGNVGGPVNVQGVIAPGSSPGTLTVAGDVTQGPASIFEAEIDGRVYNPAGGAGTYDRLNITGAASVFTADGTLRPVLRGISAPATNSFDPALGDRFRIVTTENANGINGEFASFDAFPTGLSPQLRFDVDYGNDFIDLVIVPLSYSTLVSGRNANTRNVAAALELIRPSATSNGNSDADLLFAGLRGFNDENASQVLAQISGQVHAFAFADVADLTHGMMTGVRAFDQSAMAEGKNLWAVMGGSALRYDNDSRADSYNSSHGHIWAGVDLISDRDYRLGFAIGHGTANLSAGAQGDADIQAALIMGYVARRINRVEFSAKLAYGTADIDTSRNVNLATGVQVHRADTSAEILAFELGAAMTHKLAHGFMGRSFVSLTNEWVSVDGYREFGSSVTALTIGDNNFQSTRLRLGYTVSKKMVRKKGEWHAGIALVRNFGGSAEHNVLLSGTGWTVSSPNRRDTAVEVNFGMGLEVSKKSRVHMEISHIAAGGSNRTSANILFRVNF